MEFKFGYLDLVDICEPTLFLVDHILLAMFFFT